jgi:acetyltransferase-like isoleucine patch superfamily enzyme
MLMYRPLFAAYGRNFRFDPAGTYSFATIHVGNDVSLGMRPTLNATRSTIRIGNRVMFGPEVVIRGGNHTTTLVGRFMSDITELEKCPEDDRDVVIEDDVWVGTRAIILHGVRIGRGSIVGAGAVVTRNVPPYSIVGGVPARVIRFRWDVETILRHEAMLYPVELRLLREELDGVPGRTSCS